LTNQFARLKGEVESLRTPAKRHSRLKADRAKLAAEHSDREARVEHLQTVMAAIATVAKYVQPDWNGAEVKPIRPLRRVTPLPHGEVVQSAYRVLRQATRKLTTREIIRQIAETHQIDVSDPILHDRLRDTITTTLAKMTDDVDYESDGWQRRWWIKGRVFD
jgi:hypothetical protein